MLKHIHLKLILKIAALASIFLVSSCKKEWLRITPTGKLIPTNVSDYNDMLNSTNLFSSALGISNTPDILLGDEVMADKKGFIAADPTFRYAFLWDPQYGTSGTVGPVSLVKELPSYLYTYNLIINEVLNSTGDQNQKKEVRAEALVCRAWIYLYLINLFGKPYNASTAATDPGFPIITQADALQTGFSRQSVQQVYDFMINDLKTAIPDLNTKAIQTSRPIKSAAQAILAQVYMYQGRYPEALEQLNASFNNKPAEIKLTDLTMAFAPGGAYQYDPILSPKATILTAENFQLTNPETVFVRETLGEEFQGAKMESAFLLAPWASKLFDKDDMRLKFYSPLRRPLSSPPTDQEPDVDPNGNPISNAAGASTPPLTSDSINRSGDMRRIGPMYNNIGMSLPNMYLMRAECRARTSDLNGAKSDLETLRMTRFASGKGAVPLDVVGDKNKLIHFILDERVREFALTGTRWFDMRRLSTDPDFSTTLVPQHLVRDASASNSQADSIIHLDLPNRLTLKIPQALRIENPKFLDNL